MYPRIPRREQIPRLCDVLAIRPLLRKWESFWANVCDEGNFLQVQRGSNYVPLLVLGANS